jgi:membrane protease subunit HflK
MTDPTDANTPADPSEGPPIEGDAPFGTEPMEVETPRRAASAQFVVDTEVGSDAALREAMDPANQSLADALRLSYRVLQAVIVVLIALFLVSGFQRVDQTQSGVMLRFGRIIDSDGVRALEPGLRRNLLPYPAGEFIIFDVVNLSVDLGRTFWPVIPTGMTLEQAIDRSRLASLKPGEVGTVLTADGDLAHLMLRADYEISDPVLFVERIRHEQGDAERIVKLALARAVVHLAASMTLQELVDAPEAAADRIEEKAQVVLDQLDSGIELTHVRIPDAKPPFAIVKAYRELQSAREEAHREIERARQTASQALITAAGPNWRKLFNLVRQYKVAEDLGDSAAAVALLDEVNGFLSSKDVSGDLAMIIRRAEGYESNIEMNLGNETRRFETVLRSYREQPQLTVRRELMEALNVVFGQDDIEIIRVPEGVGTIALRISGLEDIQRKRREKRLRRKKQAAMFDAVSDYTRYLLRPDDWKEGESIPILELIGDTVRSRGSDR